MKHIANHLIDLDWNFLEEFKNLILFRDPKEMLLSYTKNIETPTLLDTAYKIQYELVKFLKENQIPYYLINSKDLLLDPENKMREICNFCEIPFTKDMLSWEAGPREEDGVWAKYWYHNVHKSTRFNSYTQREGELAPDLIELCKECKRYYNLLNV